MVKQSTAERRKSVRAKRVLSVQYRLKKSKYRNRDSQWRISMTEDMSYGGLSFQVDSEYSVGDILELKVVMSGVLDIFSGNAEVVRVEWKKRHAYIVLGVKYLKPSKTHPRKSAVRRSAGRI